MKIVTWNVNGIRARADQMHVLLQRERPDIVCLQELKAEMSQVPDVVQREDYHAYWHCCKGYSGVSLQLRKDTFPETPVYVHPPFDLEARIVTADLGSFIVASMYVPNGGKDYPGKISFLKALIDWSRALRSAGRELVLCGDINVARMPMDVHPRERNPMKVGQSDEERALFEELLGTGLADVGRAVDPDNDGLFTWWAPWRNMRQRNIGWRLDYLLASPGIAGRVKSCVVEVEVGTSDHAPVMMTL